MTDLKTNSANGAMLSPTPPMIEVWDGGFVDLLKPQSWTITLRAIVRGLGYTCRYGGQISRFYSVAEHSILVRDLLRHRGAPEGLQRAALFHDAAEALLGDVVSPLKWAIRAEELQHDKESWTSDPVKAGRRSAYDHLTERMDAAIAEQFGISKPALVLPDVGIADMWALRIEAAELTASGGAHWRWPGELPEGGQMPSAVTWVGGLAPDEARVAWLDAVGAPASEYDDGDGNA